MGLLNRLIGEPLYLEFDPNVCDQELMYRIKQGMAIERGVKQLVEGKIDSLDYLDLAEQAEVEMNDYIDLATAKLHTRLMQCQHLKIN